MSNLNMDIEGLEKDFSEWGTWKPEAAMIWALIIQKYCTATSCATTTILINILTFVITLQHIRKDHLAKPERFLKEKMHVV